MEQLTTKCRSCSAEIAFTKTKKGKSMPVDAESLTDEDAELMARGGPIDYRHGDHVSHFSTCPSASEHRR